MCNLVVVFFEKACYNSLNYRESGIMPFCIRNFLAPFTVNIRQEEV